MIYPIYRYGQAVLRKVAEPIDKDFADLEPLLENMFETMHRSDGVGLAAPQIGKSIRIFVVDLSAIGEDEPQLADFKREFINPTIIEASDETCEYNEGCLSIPGVNESVERPEKVVLKYYDKNFNEHIETFEGFKARVIQHEYDHLEGVLFIDKIKALRRQLIKGKLTKILKGKAECNYKIV